MIALAFIWLVLGICLLAVAVSLTEVHVGGCVMLWQGIVGTVGGIAVAAGLTVLGRVCYLEQMVDEEDESDEEGCWGWVDELLCGERSSDEERGRERYREEEEEERLLYDV
jgi:hypothetical protein